MSKNTRMSTTGDVNTHTHIYIYIYIYIYTKVKFAQEQATKVQRGNRGRGGWSASCPGRFAPGNDPVPTV